MSKNTKTSKSNKERKTWCEDTFTFLNVSNEKPAKLPTKKDTDIESVIDRALHGIFITDKVKSVTMSKLYKVMWNYGYTKEEVDTHWEKNKDTSIDKYLDSDSVYLHGIIEKPTNVKKLKEAFSADWKLKNISVAKAKKELPEGVKGVQYTRATQKLKRTYNDDKTTKAMKEKLKAHWEKKEYFGSIED